MNTIQCSNPDCAKPLSGGLDTFGDVGVPVCWTCYMDILDEDLWDSIPKAFRPHPDNHLIKFLDEVNSNEK